MDQTRAPRPDLADPLRKYTVKEAIEYLSSLEAKRQVNLRPDCWVYNPLPPKKLDFLFAPKKILKQEPLKEKDDWLGLTPGDIIYYYGAFGVKLAVHWGVYVGNGYVLEKWRDLKDPSKADIVLNPLPLFGTEKNIVLSWDYRKFVKGLILYRKKLNDFLKKEKNQYRSIYIASNPRVKVEEMIRYLPKVGEKHPYGLFTQNCSHFVTEMEKGEKISNSFASFVQVFDIVLQKNDPKKLREFCLLTFRFH